MGVVNTILTCGDTSGLVPASRLRPPPWPATPSIDEAQRCTRLSTSVQASSSISDGSGGGGAHARLRTWVGRRGHIACSRTQQHMKSRRQQTKELAQNYIASVKPTPTYRNWCHRRPLDGGPWPRAPKSRTIRYWSNLHAARHAAAATADMSAAVTIPMEASECHAAASTCLFRGERLGVRARTPQVPAGRPLGGRVGRGLPEVHWERVQVRWGGLSYSRERAMRARE